MGKILFWFVLILVVLIAARVLTRSVTNKAEPGRLNKKGDKAAQPDMSHAEAMARCAHCGIHMPRSEAYLSDGNTWCGAEHARLGLRRP